MEWKRLVAEVEEYLDWAELPHGIDKVIRSNLEIGEVAEGERPAIEKSTKALLSKRKGSPFRKGPRTTIPYEVEENIKELCELVGEASVVYWETLPSWLIHKHKKSGSGSYESAEEYSTVERKKMKTNLERRYRNGNWDGAI